MVTAIFTLPGKPSLVAAPLEPRQGNNHGRPTMYEFEVSHA